MGAARVTEEVKKAPGTRKEKTDGDGMILGV
jgi:hypothetical protein